MPRGQRLSWCLMALGLAIMIAGLAWIPLARLGLSSAMLGLAILVTFIWVVAALAVVWRITAQSDRSIAGTANAPERDADTAQLRARRINALFAVVLVILSVPIILIVLNNVFGVTGDAAILIGMVISCGIGIPLVLYAGRLSPFRRL